MRDCAISHGIPDLKAIDWQGIREMYTWSAANALQDLLGGLDDIEGHVFAARGMAALIIEERELWHDLNYLSLDACLKGICPKSWGYVRDAMRTVRELREMPLSDLLAIPRVNLKTLAEMSSGVRCAPPVIEAAKTLSETDFREKMLANYPEQHLESMVTIRLRYPAGDAATVLRVLGKIGEKLDAQDPAGSLLAWCVDWEQEQA